MELLLRVKRNCQLENDCLYNCMFLKVSLRGLVGDNVFDERKDVEFCLGEGTLY